MILVLNDPDTILGLIGLFIALISLWFISLGIEWWIVWSLVKAFRIIENYQATQEEELKHVKEKIEEIHKRVDEEIIKSLCTANIAIPYKEDNSPFVTKEKW